jgi:putative membrane protein
MVVNHGGRFQGPPGPFLVHHNWWWGFWSHFLAFLFFLALIALVVWVVVRLTNRPQATSMVPLGMATALPRDPALEEVRLRYARGEMTREEFVQRSRDLGGQAEPPQTEPPRVEPPQTEVGPTEPPQTEPPEAG